MSRRPPQYARQRYILSASVYSIDTKSLILQAGYPVRSLNSKKRFLLEDLKEGGFGNIYKRRERLKAFEAAWRDFKAISRDGRIIL